MGQKIARYTVVPTICLILLLILVLFAADVLPFTGPPPASTRKPPIYPGAQQVQIEGSDVLGTPITVTFQTSDTSEDVMRFYKDSLSKDGWDLVRSERDHLNFVWMPRSKAIESVWGIGLMISDIGSGKNLVELRLRKIKAF